MKKEVGVMPGRRATLVQAPIYQIWLDCEWQQDNRYRLQPWFRWGLCRLDEVVELINKQFGVRWTKKGLLQRFAIPREEGRMKVPNGTTRYDLYLIWIGDKELQYDIYKNDHLKFVDVWALPVYVPSGWVKDVFWALYAHCTRAKRSSSGHKVACSEDGDPVFQMSGASGAGSTNLNSSKGQ